MKTNLSFIFILVFTSTLFCQNTKLKPGFDKEEYLELIKISTRQLDSLYNPDLPGPEKFKQVYQSQEMGLDNRWGLWVSPDSIATISIRGTTMHTESWLENFYAAMVPAKGKLKLSNNFTFNYNLSNHPKAAIHTGWLIGTAFLARDILPKIDSCYKQGIKDFYIFGHSQGGAIAYLMNSHLENLKNNGKINPDITFKTYCSAAPKPGNLYYAYSYENKTQNGWAFNIVNTADWVPEGPFSIQTIDDYNDSNPFKYAKSTIKKVPFPKSLILKYAFNKLDKPTKRANKNYQKYLGKIMGKYIKKYLPEYEIPQYYNSNNYSRAGRFITLYADNEYYKLFPDIEGQIWNHHKFEAYIYLIEKLKE